MGRPFFNRSIAELEQMFEQRSGDPQFDPPPEKYAIEKLVFLA